jgi:two-component system sensor histidine kinase/response regulator
MTKILVIEDEAMLRQGVSEILTYEGFEVLEAQNGERGIVAAFQYSPDLILCDIMMPVMDGYEVLCQLRKNESTKLIPFIFMTALAERSDLRSGMELGSDDYITKPYTRDELLSAVNTQLKKSTDKQEFTESRLDELRKTIIRHLPHELRTPLNGILGFGELLMNYSDTVSHDELPLIGKNIYESAIRLNRLTQNYLTYMQLELGSGVPFVENTLHNLEKICERKAKEMANQHLRLDDLELKLSISAACIRETEFVKIVEELTDNAFKFSSVGNKVSIGCETRGDKFILKVKDHGRGIMVSDISRIGAFMQFERKRFEQQGSGLGLIITKRLVESFKGELKIESIVGEGTTIVVTLPGN